MFERILVPLDGSPLAECVLPHVVALARAFNSQVILLQVLEPLHGSALAQAVDPLEWQYVKAEAEAYLNGIAARLEDFGLKVQRTLKEGIAAEHIIEFAHRNGIDLIVLSSNGRSGLSDWNISIVVQKIVLWAYTSILIVRAHLSADKELANLGYQHILVPLDGSRRAENVLPPTMILSRFYGSRLLLAHLVCKPEMPSRTPLTPAEAELVNKITERNRHEATQYLEEIRSGSMAGVDTRLYIREGNNADLLNLVELEDVDLVVLSAHGHSGNPKWPYGSLTLSYIAYGTTPLLIVQDLSWDEEQMTVADIVAREAKGH